MRQQRLVKRRNQRRALPAKGDVATAEIPHDRHTGFGDDLVIIANLHRMRRVAKRFVPHGLPMTANRHDVLWLKIFLLHECQHRIGKQRSQLHI
ncbi:hypothetical protein D3C81_1848850 [compost metagenome]